MQAIPADHAGRIKVAVSMDANTLSLGYLIKPTLVTVDDRTPASVVITDLLSENGYDWENTGSITNSFYLAGVKPVNQALSMSSVVPVLPAAVRPLRGMSFPVPSLSNTWVRVSAV